MSHPYSTLDEPTTLIDTIPFPLGTDVSGVVFYKNLSILPEFGNTYSLYDAATSVSAVFDPIRSNLIDTSNILGYTFPNDAFDKRVLINLITSSKNTCIIYAIGTIQYTTTEQVLINDDPNNITYESRDVFTNQECFLKVDTNYGTLTYLSIIEEGFSRMVLDEQNTTVYLLKNENQNTVIKNISVDDGTITNVFSEAGSTTEPADMKLGPDGNLYVSLHGTGQIKKIVPSTGSSSIYATLEYPYTIYGYNDLTNNNTYKGKIQGIAFDPSGNLYVSDNGTSFNLGSFSNPNVISSPYIFRIPYNNIDGTTYNPDDAITEFKNDPKSDTYQMMFGNFGELYFISHSDANLYKNNFNNVFVTSDKIVNHGANDILTKDSWGNLYYINNSNGINKISTDYFNFTRAFVSDYHSDISLSLILKDSTDQIISDKVLVFSSLSDDTSLSTFTINEIDVVNGEPIVLDNVTTEVLVGATPTNYYATVTSITGNTGLTTANNTVSVIVTAQNGKRETHSVIVRVNAVTAPDILSTFTIADIDVLSLDSIRVVFTVKNVNVIAIPIDLTASVQITGNQNLKTGNNPITVTVTMPNSGPSYTFIRNVTVSSPCLLKGTKVKTPNGYIPIEQMKVGYPIIVHDGSITKVTKVGKWECDICNEYDKIDRSKIMYKIPAGEYNCTSPLYISYFHRVFTSNQWLRFPKNLGFKPADISELSSSGDGRYTIYNLAVENGKHLVVNGECIVESWTSDSNSN